jgi:trimethylamine--corrinoid protein Co-methyltransferase
MRSGAPIWGNPEVGIVSAGTVQIGHSYGLPVNVYGLASSSFGIDIQSGYERAINALTPALAGADELSGVGEMAGGIYSCNAQIMIDNDIYGMVQRVRRGFPVDQDSLAVEVVQKVMDGTRSFIGEKHTRKYLRDGELWFGRLGVPESGWESWFSAGQPSVVERAQVEVENLLKNHAVEPISDEQDRELSAIMLSIKENSD